MSIETALEKISKIHFDQNEMVSSNGAINFWIDELEFYVPFKQNKDMIMAVQVIHFRGGGVCPFCNEAVENKTPCLGLLRPLDNFHTVLQYLTNHPSIRLRLALLGIQSKSEIE